jgi:PAS domain S-box-containing protein
MKFLLSRRSLLRVCPVLLLLIVTAYASIYGTSRLLATDAAISESVNARRAARDLLFSMMDLETGMRGFVITGEEAYLGPFHVATARAGGQIDEMQRLLSDDPGQRQRIAELRSLVAAEIAASQRLVSLQRASGAESASLALKTGDTKVRMDRIRQVIAEVQVAQDRSLDQQGLRGDSAARQARNTVQTIVVANAVAMIVVLAACYFVFLGDNRRRQAEQQLIQSESRFRLLVDDAREHAIFLLDPEGLIKTWNAGAERINGYRAREIIGRHISCVYPGGDDDHDKVQAELKTALEKGQFEEDGWRVRKDQTQFWANDVVTPLLDEKGTHIGFSRITRDLTERKNAAEMLIASESRFRLLVDNVKEYAIFLLDSEGRITTWNAGAERINGYRAREIIGRHISCVYPGGDDDREKVETELHTALEKGSFEEDGWRVRKDQTRFWANDLVTPLFDQKGTHIGFSRITRDLSERKRAEEQLIASESRFRLLVDNVKEYAIFLLDGEGRITTWNAGAERINGYRADEIIGRHISCVYPGGEADREKVQAELKAALEKGSFEEDGWRVRKDQSRFWANDVVTPLFDPQGMHVGFSRITRDLTERKHAEELLIASESNFRLLVDNAKEYAMFLLDREGRIKTWNAGAERIKGYRADEIIGRDLSCLYPGGDTDREKIQAELKTALEMGQFEAHDWRLRKDHTRFWADVLITPLFDAQGTHIGFSKITRDLTERKRAEEQLKAAESSFRLLVDNTREYAIFLLDPEGLIKTWNAGAERIKGYRADEIIGRHVSCVYPGGDDDREKVQAELKIALEKGQFEEDGWRVRKDQTRFWANDVVTPLFDSQGEHIGFSRITRDLTERKRAEEQLIASESRFRLLVDNVKEYAIFLLDSQGRITTWNAGAEQINGYLAREIIGRHISCVYPGGDDDREKVQAELKTALEKGQFKEDGWRVRKDQSRFWANDVVTPLFDPQGMHIGFSRITRDLSERKRAEEQLIASELRFRLLVDNVKEYAIFLLDPEGRIKTWNAGAERIKGYRADEIIGHHISCVYPGGEADREKAQAELQTALEKGQFEEDGWRVRKDQTRFWANDVVTPLFDAQGAHIGFSRITRDISERKRAEEEIQQFFTLSLDLLCILGTDGYFKRLNPAWETTLGYTNAELRGSPHIEFVHVDDRAATLVTSAKLSAGEPIAEFENRYRCKDGSYRWLLWKSAGSADRKLIYAAACDITQRKAAETSIAELNRASELRNMELEAANKELESFSYSVSHDLRTPLRSLDGFSQALLEDYGDKLDHEGQENLHRIRAASQRMGQLIDDLLNLSRVTRVEMTRETVDVSKMAREIADEVRGSETGREVDFVIADHLFANSDARLLRIVLTNLLNNAWKFTGKRPRARIEFGCRSENGMDSYFVRDNGAGFDMLFAKKLFGAFQRLHGAGEFPGTGIGLATVQRIVHRFGGRIWAEAELDGGATFHFTLQPPLLSIAA